MLLTEQIEEAIQCFQTSVRLDEQLLEGYRNLGKAYFLTNKVQEAIANFQKVVELDQSDSQPFYYIGDILKHTNRKE